MKIKSQRDFWSGLMFLVVGAGFAVGAFNYSMGASARPGPGYFPLILGTLTAILGCVVLFKAMTIETEDGEPVGAFAWRPLIVIVAAIMMFGFLLPILGMVIVIPLLIVLTSFAGTDIRWKGIIANAIILDVASYMIFIYGLKLTIPLWPMWVQ